MSNSTPFWHSSAITEIFGWLKTKQIGLTSQEAAVRLRQTGPNLIERARRRAWFIILIQQIADPLIYVLIAAALLAVTMGKVTDGMVILTVILLNMVIGFVQEMRASRAIEALSQMIPQTAIVLRDGSPTLLNANVIVPGDVLILQPGDQIAADIRLFDVNGLQVDEAALTGESLSVSKQATPVANNTVLGDRYSMAYAGTLVTAGTAQGVVVATGIQSELGRISHLLGETVTLQTPLTRRLAKLAKTITLVILTFAGLIFLVGLWRNSLLLDSALAAITLAVAFIPEGLPAVITITSAIGVQRMARRHVIIRHLPAVETLGSTTVICTDKTGTLTRNEMTVEVLWTPTSEIEVTGVGYKPSGDLRIAGHPLDSLPDDIQTLLLAGMLCNDASLEFDNECWSIVGDPTEGALVVVARKASLDVEALRGLFLRLDEIPFSSENQFMATLHSTASNERLICLKGAPEVIAKLCPAFSKGYATSMEGVHEAAHRLATRGMRILAIAVGESTAPMVDLAGTAWQESLRFVGIIGMADPPRPEVIEAVKTCQGAGIIVKMITGDHAETARAIGKSIGLLPLGDTSMPVVTGHQIEMASETEIIELVRSAHVFARVAPEHKLRLVKALQADGQVVAMTGDGVNDAPALKRAEIGVAMGVNGTAVAKEAADMVLANDNFASISAAVEEGRRVYDNLAKSLAFILPTGVGQAMIILIAVLFFPVTEGRLLMPIEPVQILWVNLVVAVALGLPLAFEVQEPGLMERAPRPSNEPLLSPFLIYRSLLTGGLMTAGAVGLFLHEYHADLVLGIPEAVARVESQTIAVTTIILFQILYLLNCRSLTQGIYRIGLFSNQWVFVGVIVTLGLQLAFVYFSPFNNLFHTHPLKAADWIQCGFIAWVGFLVISIEKWFWRRKHAAQLIRNNLKAGLGT